jgi:sulfur carrier protein
MDISLNGAPYSAAGATLEDLLAEHAIDPTKPGVAVALNDSIVPRGAWHSARLREGDVVEIVRPHSGG